MMDDREDRADQWLREAAKDYNPPPPVPRAEMWQRIEAARRGAAVTPIRRAAPWRMPLAVAALLLLGVAIGRVTSPRPTTSTNTPAGAPAASAAVPNTERGTVANRLVTDDLLSQAETFLTEFNTQAAAEDFSVKAKDLLITTRLLLDSKRRADAPTRKLLEDLELVLAQIATLDPEDQRQERGFIADGLAQNQLRSRLRNAIPSGPAIRL